MVYKSIPVTEETYRRLRYYKMRGAAFDEVINELMRSVPVEVLAERVIKEHCERMREREGSPWRQVVEKRKRRA
jgi:predicted CopG family antitoxin